MEAIQRAIDQAHAIEDRDPDAARQLLAQASRARARLGDGNAGSLEPYDAMRTRARLLIKYKGGLSRTDLKTMDYREYLGFIRELDLYEEEVAKQYKTNDQGNSMDASRIVNEFPHPQPYEGEVIKLI